MALFTFPTEQSGAAPVQVAIEAHDVVAVEKDTQLLVLQLAEDKNPVCAFEALRQTLADAGVKIPLVVLMGEEHSVFALDEGVMNSLGWYRPADLPSFQVQG